MSFLRAFAQSPGSVGAVAPSSRLLAERMVAGVGLESAEVVVEFGPGTGGLTRTVLAHLGPGARFLAVELNEPFVRHLRERFPGVDVHHGSAVETPALLAARGLGPADVVISGLPWASFPPRAQHRLLRAAHEALRPGGSFVTFAYAGPSLLPRGRRFRALLHRVFGEVRTTPLVWRNLPPAFAYQCRK